VSFAGPIVGRLSVTVHHGGIVRTSYSYLDTISVVRGQRVDRGDVLGTSGIHDDRAAFHFSVRLGDTYVDPISAL
jgi:murein DD-endopeptidase MepM/ murein hydrolase activator NlpD